MRKFKQVRYTATHDRWGRMLDLSSVDGRSLIAFRSLGGENQQVKNLLSFFFLSAATVRKMLIVILP